jgi:cytidylate kinase
MTIPVVAIDGPAGAGKSTVARAVADALGVNVLDTGAMYRAVTLIVLARGLDPEDGAAAAKITDEIAIDVGERVTIDGRDVSEEIRTPAVTAAVSAVSAHPAVRRELIDQQRAWVAAHGSGVAEGRDMASVVFPDARLKVFLTASPAERAARRYEERRHEIEDVDAAHRALIERDTLDHETNPLVPVEGALVVDTTGRTIDDVVAQIVAAYREAQ